MANELSAAVPKIIADILLQLEGEVVLGSLYSHRYEAAPKKGNTVTVPIVGTVPVQTVVPGHVSQDTGDVSLTSVEVTCDTWSEAAFTMTDQDLIEVLDGTELAFIASAATALVEDINEDCADLYKKVWNSVGAAGTDPFGTDTSEATAARKALNIQKVPKPNRYFVMNHDAEAEALNLRAFQDLSWSGDREAFQEGKLPRRLGFYFVTDGQIPDHTAGTITTGLITKASTVVAVGVKTFTATTAASTGACALKIGDLINIAGHPYTYTLTAAATQASAASDVTIAVEPGLQVALAGSEAITVVASHAANLAFHPSWAAFAMLPMNSIKRKVAITQTFIHEKSGIPLRLYIEEESRQFRFALEAFYGIKEVRTECAVRVLGA